MRTAPNRTMLALAAVGFLVLAGACAKGLRHGGVAKSLIPPEQRVAAKDFALKDLFGNPVTLAKYRGSVVLLGFWAVG